MRDRAAATVARAAPPPHRKTFTYLGSTLVEDGKLDAEGAHRVPC